MIGNANLIFYKFNTCIKLQNGQYTLLMSKLSQRSINLQDHLEVGMAKAMNSLMLV